MISELVTARLKPSPFRDNYKSKNNYKSERRISGATTRCSPPQSGQVSVQSRSGVRWSTVMVRSCPLGHSVRNVVWPGRQMEVPLRHSSNFVRRMSQVVARRGVVGHVPKVRFTAW